MRIQPKAPSVPASAVRPTGAEPTRTTARPTPVRTDSVAISNEGRAASAGVNAAKLADVQDRIRSGFYNSTEVADAVARAIVARGDL